MKSDGLNFFLRSVIIWITDRNDCMGGEYDSFKKYCGNAIQIDV